MNLLVIKLLRQHLSVGQFLGFSFANLLGMAIVLLGGQFYVDVLPIFTQGDSFMKETYLVVGKEVTTAQTLMGKTPHFSAEEIADVEQQPFVNEVGCFIPAQFDISASLGSRELGLGLSTDLFFEAIPDRFVDADLSLWHYDDQSDTIPVILPRSYLTLYNLGFASSRGLPALSESLIGMVKINFHLRGTSGERFMHGKVVAFSDRINTILVPQGFQETANAELSPDRIVKPSRLILEVNHPADSRIATYLSSRHYVEEGSAADAGRMAFFLRLVIGIVVVVGLVICALSFFVLLLSIYLLLQKHTEKIDTLLLLGYTPSSVARPFQWLSLGLNVSVLLLSLSLVGVVREYYLTQIFEIYPQLAVTNLWPTVCGGCLLCLTVVGLNYFLIRRKVNHIWSMHRVEK